MGESVTLLGTNTGPGVELKVRGLQALGSTQNTTGAGMRTAVNLSGKGTEGIKRGMTIAATDTFQSVSSAVAWIEVLQSAPALTEGTVTTHLGTTERETRLIPLGTETLEPGEAGGVLLRFLQPVPAFAGQRLVLRRPGLHGQATIGGGEVLDPEPPTGKGAVSLAASQLHSLRGNAKERLRALARESRAAGINRQAITRRLPPGEARRSAEFLEKKGHLSRIPGQEERWVDSDLLATVVRQAVTMVGNLHDLQPMAEGMLEAEIGSRLPPPEQHLAPLAVNRAVADKKLQRFGAVVAVPGRGSAVSPLDQEDMARISELLSSMELTPPSDTQLKEELQLDEKRLQQLLGYMRRSGNVVKVCTGQHYWTDSLVSLQVRIISSLSAGAELSASEFKDIAGGISRKYAIPLLEYFDREKVTQRIGNLRKLHPTQQNQEVHP